MLVLTEAMARVKCWVNESVSEPSLGMEGG